MSVNGTAKRRGRPIKFRPEHVEEVEKGFACGKSLGEIAVAIGGSEAGLRDALLRLGYRVHGKRLFPVQDDLTT